MRPLLSTLCVSRILLGLLFLMPIGTAAQPQTLNPDQEQHSVIREVDAYAHLSENMTLAEVRKAAFATAKQQALEGAQTHIQANTMMKNGQIEYDIVVVEGEGMVRVLEQKDLGVEDNSRYHVWIKAEVVYTLKPKEPSATSAVLMAPQAPLTVKVWTETKQYRQGQHIVIYMQGNKDFYARIVNYTSTGEIIQLLPNVHQSSAFFRGGKQYRIPDREDTFALEVRPPFGTERIVVYASEVELGPVPMQPISGEFQQYQGSEQTIAKQARAVVPVARHGTEFYEATWTFSTRP